MENIIFRFLQSSFFSFFVASLPSLFFLLALFTDSSNIFFFFLRRVQPRSRIGEDVSPFSVVSLCTVGLRSPYPDLESTSKALNLT